MELTGFMIQNRGLTVITMAIAIATLLLSCSSTALSSEIRVKTEGHVTNSVIDDTAITNLSFGTMSKPDSRWNPQGIFGGYSPNDEIIEKRTRLSKTFKNPDGTYTAQLSGLTHYADKNGAWQDIDFTIVKNDSEQHAEHEFCNLTHELKTYFSNSPDDKGMKIIHEGREYSWWINPHFRLLDESNVVSSTVFPNSVSALLNENPIGGMRDFASNRLVFEEIYPGMDEEFEVTYGGVINNVIIKEIHDGLLDYNSAASIGFAQFVPLRPDEKVLLNGQEMIADFSGKTVSIVRRDVENSMTFAPIVVFDSNIEDKFTAKNIIESTTTGGRGNSVIYGEYHVEFVEGGILLTAVVPLRWLSDADRVFPITVDPEVIVYETGGANSNYLWDGYYCNTRTQPLYLSSYFSDVGIGDGAEISAIGLYLGSCNCPGVTQTGLAIRMQNTTHDVPYLDYFINTGYTDCYDGGSHFISGTGWYNHSFHTIYTFDASYNLYIDFLMSMDARNCTAHNYWRMVLPSPGNYPSRRDSLNCFEEPKEWTERIGSINLRPSLRVTYNQTCTPPDDPRFVSATPSIICAGSSSELSASSTGATAIHWFTGSCGGTYVGSSVPGTGSLSVSPSATTTYYARGYNSEGSGCYSEDCVPITVTVYNDVSVGVWTGYADTDWSNHQNWGRCTLPNSTTDAIIPAIPLYGRFPTVDTDDGSCVCRTITIDGTINGAAGNLYIYGEWLNNGTFNCGTGTITFIGSGEPAIGGSIDTEFYNIVAKNIAEPIDLRRDSAAEEIDLRELGGEGLDIRGGQEVDLR